MFECEAETVSHQNHGQKEGEGFACPPSSLHSSLPPQPKSSKGKARNRQEARQGDRGERQIGIEKEEGWRWRREELVRMCEATCA